MHATRLWFPLLLSAALTLAARPAFAGPPFVTDDPEPVDYEHVEINIAAIGLAQKSGTASPAPMVDANWGPAPDVQLHAGFGLAFAESKGAFDTGYGDTEFGVKYRFIHQDEDGWLPDVAFYPNIELPTGNAARGLGAGHTQLLLPIWIQKDWDEWSSYGGVGYWENHSTDARNYWFAGWTLMRKVADDLQLGGELYRQTASVADQPGTTGVNLGGMWDLSETGHILFSFGRGLTDAQTVDRFSFYLGYQITL
jgi:hypothetical protein